MSEHLHELVRSELSVRLGDRRGWYALVDPAISDPFADYEGRRLAIPLVIRHVDMPQHLRPYLLALGEIGRDDHIDLTIRIAVDEAARAAPCNGSKRTICGWIASEQPASAIAAHLARHARISTHNRARTLRIWDPRTLDLLEYLLASRVTESLALPGADWWWLGRNVSVKELRSAQTSAPLSVGAHLNDEQVEALLLAEPLHATLNVLQDMGKDAVREQTLRTIIQALRRASAQWGVSDQLGQVGFALHSCLVHADFDTDIEVAAAMRRSKDAGQAPTQVLTSFDEQAWNAVRGRLRGGGRNVNTIGNGELNHG